MSRKEVREWPSSYFAQAKSGNEEHVGSLPQPINRAVGININSKVFSIKVCEEVIERGQINQVDDYFNQELKVTKAFEASSRIKLIPEQSLNWVFETMSTYRVTSPVRVNPRLTVAQSTNDEPQTALQICFGKRADPNSTFGRGDIKNNQKKKRIGIRETQFEGPKNGEKEITVTEAHEREKSEKNMPVGVEKGCFLADQFVGKKLAEESYIGRPNEDLHNQTKGDNMEEPVTGEETMAHEKISVRPKSSKAHIIQEGMDCLKSQLVNLNKQKKVASRER
ncbi:hypothetical protein Ancab_021151 [Ancistrocladus abbreviatus]